MNLEIKRLISSRLFGELLRSEEPGFKNRIDYLEFYERFRNNYDDLLKQKLELWMFVPCKLVEGVWVVLEEPEWWHRYCNGASPFMNMDEIRPCQEYKKAKELCYFEGLKIIDKGNFYFIEKEDSCLYFRILKRSEGTIEFLLKNGWDIELTPTAQKQIGL